LDIADINQIQELLYSD